MEIVFYVNSIPGNYIDGLVQKRHNSSALAMELRFFCTNPSISLQKNLHMPAQQPCATFFNDLFVRI